jgi:DNA modification methylase
MPCGKKIGPFDCCSVVQGDCLELMKLLPTGCVDAVITDPPYGVNLGKHLGASDMRVGHVLRKSESYSLYEDTFENYKSEIVPRIRFAISIAKRSLIFCAGCNVQLLPKADSIGGIFLPSARGCNKWGYTSFIPALLYGQAPHLEKGNKATVLRSCEIAEKNGHPCPKPEGWMLWAVNLASWDGELIIDPFAGSGTTLVAATKLHRHYLGFDLDGNYCEIARKRLAKAEELPMWACSENERGTEEMFCG